MIARIAKLLILPILIGIAILINLERPASKSHSVSHSSERLARDGDSLNFGEGVRIRLYAVDAAELAQKCARASGEIWDCGDWAHQQLAGMMDGSTIACETVDEDRYGRAVGRCRTEHVGDIGASLVRQGAAVALRIDGRRPYADEEKAARAAKLGMWQGRFERPSDWRARNPRY